jgi:hypothetical protein
VKNDSLEVPGGRRRHRDRREKFSRKVNLTEEQRTGTCEIRKAEKDFLQYFRDELRTLVNEIQDILGSKINDPNTKKAIKIEDTDLYASCVGSST